MDIAWARQIPSFAGALLILLAYAGQQADRIDSVGQLLRGHDGLMILDWIVLSRRPRV
jgi:hypothetical protein